MTDEQIAQAERDADYWLGMCDGRLDTITPRLCHSVKQLAAALRKVTTERDAPMTEPLTAADLERAAVLGVIEGK